MAIAKTVNSCEMASDGLVTVLLLLVVQPTATALRRRAPLACTQSIPTLKNAHDLRILLCINLWWQKRIACAPAVGRFFLRNERVFVFSRNRSNLYDTERNRVLAVASFQPTRSLICSWDR